MSLMTRYLTRRSPFSRSLVSVRVHVRPCSQTLNLNTNRAAGTQKGEQSVSNPRQEVLDHFVDRPGCVNPHVRLGVGEPAPQVELLHLQQIGRERATAVG